MTPAQEPLKILPLLTDIEYYILMAILIEPRHGIGIFEEVAQQTQNQLVLSPGTLYAALKRMYASGWITLVEPDAAGYPADERRKIYVATTVGIQAVKAKVAWFEHEAARARKVLRRNTPNDPNASGARQTHLLADDDADDHTNQPTSVALAFRRRLATVLSSI